MTQPPSPRAKPFYGPQDVADTAYATQLNDPGTFPFTRGRRAAPVASGAWIQRELSGEGDARRTNAQFHYLLATGATGLDVIGDTPTMALLDPDHPAAVHAVGTQGVSLCCLQDYLDLYEGVALDSVTISNSLPAVFAIAGLYAAAQARGLDPARLRGSTVQAPFYCEDCGYATHMPFDLRVRLAADSIAFAARRLPRFHAFLEDTYYISEGGLDAVDEMALGFIEIRSLIKAVLQRGLPVDAFGPRIAILVNCRMDFFTEVAKIRATRRLFARMLRDEFGATDPRALAVNIASHTSGLSLTTQQPINNVVRGTVQALALALAGVQGIEISGFDEAFRTPSPEAHLVGLRTQQIVQLEANVSQVLDPLGGSYYVEALTNDIEQRIRARVAEIEAQGDPKILCDGGWFRALFQDASERYACELRDGARVQVGLNAHRLPEAEDTLLRGVVEQKIEPYRERIDQIRAFKAVRDRSQLGAALEAVRNAVPAGDNLMPHIIAAMQAGATMGEIAGTLRVACGMPYDPFGMTRCPT